VTSIADNPRSHAQVTPFYQVRTTQEPVYQAQGKRGTVARRPRAGADAGAAPRTYQANTDKRLFVK